MQRAAICLGDTCCQRNCSPTDIFVLTPTTFNHHHRYNTIPLSAPFGAFPVNTAVLPGSGGDLAFCRDNGDMDYYTYKLKPSYLDYITNWQPDPLTMTVLLPAVLLLHAFLLCLVTIAAAAILLPLLPLLPSTLIPCCIPSCYILLVPPLTIAPQFPLLCCCCLAPSSPVPCLGRALLAVPLSPPYLPSLPCFKICLHVYPVTPQPGLTLSVPTPLPAVPYSLPDCCLPCALAFCHSPTPLTCLPFIFLPVLLLLLLTHCLTAVTFSFFFVILCTAIPA